MASIVFELDIMDILFTGILLAFVVYLHGSSF